MSDATTALAAAQAAAASSQTASDAADFAAEKAVEVNADRVAAQAAAAAAGAQMWVGGEAVTTATVRQAPDGSRIKSNAARTTRATFDPTEQTFWTPVLSTAGTLEQVALTTAIDTAKRAPTQPLVGAQQILDSLSSAVLTGWTVGTPTTGLSEPDTTAAVTAFNTLSGGSYVAADLVRTEPTYGTPRKDPVYRINGPFKYKDDNTAQHVGTWAASRTDALPGGGSTGNQGQVSFTLPAGSRYFLMRYRAIGSGSTVMKARIWASKDGGTPKPFRDLSDHDGNIELTLPSDNLYALLPVDLGATGTWTLTIDFATATFGGIYTLATLPPTSPAVRAGRALIIGDSFATPGQGQFATSLGYVMKVVRALGLEAHVSAQGGTGVVARNGNPGVGTYYNYLERVTQAGGDVDGYFDDNDQPAYIGLQLSQNDRTFLFDPALGVADPVGQFTTNFAALCRALRGRFPNVPFDVYGIMHTRTETFQDQYFAIEDAAIAFLNANPDLNIGYVPGLLRAGVALDAGDVWSDNSHASPAGHVKIANQILTTTTAKRPQLLRPDGGYQRPRSISIAEWNALQADKVSTLTAKAVAAAWRPVRDLGSVAISGLAAGTTYLWAPGVGVVTAATAGSAAAAFQIDDDQYAISGLTTKMRLSLNGFVNATAPGCDIVAELVLAGALSGAGDPSIAAGASLSPAYVATIAAPTANSKPAVSSGQVTAPATNTFYVVKVTVSANMAAGSTVRLRAWLEANNT